MILPDGAYRSRRWTDQSRLAIIDADKHPDTEWLKPERSQRWVIAKLTIDGVIVIWGEATSRANAIRIYEKLLAGEGSDRVWHEKFRVRETTNDLLRFDRGQLELRLSQALRVGVSMEELASWAIDIAKYATKRVGNASIEVPDHSTRLKAIDWIATRLIGTVRPPPNEMSAEKQFSKEEAFGRFFRSPFFRKWAEENAPKYLGSDGIGTLVEGS